LFEKRKAGGFPQEKQLQEGIFPRPTRLRRNRCRFCQKRRTLWFFKQSLETVSGDSCPRKCVSAFAGQRGRYWGLEPKAPWKGGPGM